MRRFMIAGLSMILAGCSASSPYKEFYRASGGFGPTLDVFVVASEDKPLFRKGTDPKTDNILMVENGYKLLGASNFTGGPVDSLLALQQAEEVKAAAVIVYANQESMLVGVKTRQLVLQSAHANNWGRGAPTDSGPMNFATQAYFNHLATYWVKTRPGILGAHCEVSTRLEERASKRKGMVVRAVRKDSVAYRAGIFRDDLIYRINYFEVDSPRAFDEALQRYQGQRVSVRFVRDGQEKTLDVQLASSWQ